MGHNHQQRSVGERSERTSTLTLNNKSHACQLRRLLALIFSVRLIRYEIRNGFPRGTVAGEEEFADEKNRRKLDVFDPTSNTQLGGRE